MILDNDDDAAARDLDERRAGVEALLATRTQALDEGRVNDAQKINDEQLVPARWDLKGHECLFELRTLRAELRRAHGTLTSLELSDTDMAELAGVPQEALAAQLSGAADTDLRTLLGLRNRLTTCVTAVEQYQEHHPGATPADVNAWLQKSNLVLGDSPLAHIAGGGGSLALTYAAMSPESLARVEALAGVSATVLSPVRTAKIASLAAPGGGTPVQLADPARGRAGSL